MWKKYLLINEKMREEQPSFSYAMYELGMETQMKQITEKYYSTVC